MITTEILGSILEAVDAVNQQLPPDARIERSPKAHLTGAGGRLDSLGLVNLIVAVEQSVQRNLGKTIVLTGEDTLGNAERIFATVDSLAQHVERLLLSK